MTRWGDQDRLYPPGCGWIAVAVLIALAVAILLYAPWLS